MKQTPVPRTSGPSKSKVRESIQNGTRMKTIEDAQDLWNRLVLSLEWKAEWVTECISNLSIQSSLRWLCLQECVCLPACLMRVAWTERMSNEAVLWKAISHRKLFLFRKSQKDRFVYYGRTNWKHWLRRLTKKATKKGVFLGSSNSYCMHG